MSISVKEEVMQIGTPGRLEQRESAAVAPPPESEAGGDSTVTPTGSGVELPEPAVLAEHRFHWPEIQQITGYTADQLRAYADARVVAATKALKDWRFEVCERLGLSCAAGAEWSPDQIWQHVTDVEIALNQRAESAERERDAVSETLASVIADTAKVLGCEPDNEAILQAIGKLRKDAERYQWRPIETAPKDGTAILAARIGEDIGMGAVEIVEWCVMENWHWEEAGDNLYRKVYDPPTEFWNGNGHRATHWMPSPNPPAIDAAIAAERENQQ